MKKRRIKKKKLILFIIVVVLFFSLLLFFPYLIVKIKLIGDKKIILNYGDEYSEPGYKAYIFGKNITSDVKVVNNIKDDIGKYKIIYSYKFLFYKIKKIRYISIEDIEGPVITFENGPDYEVVINEPFNGLDYKAVDNKDGDLTDSVEINGTVDTTKLGEYKITYDVVDSSCNRTTEIKNIKVVNKSPMQMSISEYTLDGWYDEIKVKEKDNKGDDYFNKITMVGDSNTMYMYTGGYLSGLRAWAIPCLHADGMLNSEINLYGLEKKMKLLDAVNEYKPEIMILNFGTFSTAWINQDVFIESANTIIQKIKELSPTTTILLISIYPILENGPNINNFSQDVINKYNFMILELASKYNLNYLDIQEILKNDRGYGKIELYESDGYHLNNLGHSLVKEYIKTHWVEGE